MLTSSRRSLLTAVPAAAAVGSVPAKAAAGDIGRQVKSLFAGLPGVHAIQFWAPPSPGGSELLVETKPDKRLFIASAFKAFVLAARLKVLDSPDIVAALQDNKLVLDKNIYSLGSDVFNPPELNGLVRERTAAEAMIMHSDNTATDMILKVTGATEVRQFIATLALKRTQIPDSTRALTAYLLGFPNYLAATYDDVLEALMRGAPFVHPFLNDIETMASSASDLVAFYSATLQDGFFQNTETLEEYRRILALADGVFQARPLGTTGFAKTGYADFPGFHVRSNAGGVTFGGQWVYYAAILNWDAPDLRDDATVEKWFAAIRSALQIIYEARA
jgi:beta-lactamase class A